jgi:phage FluMu protein Com
LPKMKMRPQKKYKDPVVCPVCKKVFGEWVYVSGKASIRKWCPRCKAYREITKESEMAQK